MLDGITVDRADPHALYLAATFGLVVSHDDACTLHWVCAANLGYEGPWDPKYAIARGAIYATSFRGLAISRDGGCSFAMARDLGTKWIDTIDVGPNGDVWVGTAISGAPNEVFVSRDGGASFAPVGLQSPKIFWKSVRVAASDPARIYASGYEVAPPTAHLESSRDGGRSWAAPSLAGVALGPTPIVLVAAVDPRAAETFYLVSAGANPPAGDRLYRTTDGGATFADVLDATGSIHDVVIDPRHGVLVSTFARAGADRAPGPAFRARDGIAFARLGSPALACLGVGPDGALLGCAQTSLIRSSDDGKTWSELAKLGGVAGPLACPAGTPEHDKCDVAEIASLVGPPERTCVADRDDVAIATPTAPRGCDAGDPLGWPIALLVLIALRRASSDSAA
ncbi:MAG TPA: hypothetical protein VH143_32105 [Kofleriaceae bacterium]|nr:hypothetical protein [Kofleriaceae bacterium]